MCRSKFTKTQIVSILNEAGAGRPDNESLADVRHQLRHLLQMEGQVRRAGGLGCEAAQGTGAQKEPPQADVCRLVPGERGPEGCDRKKALRPAKRREVVMHLLTSNASIGRTGQKY